MSPWLQHAVITAASSDCTSLTHSSNNISIVNNVDKDRNEDDKNIKHKLCAYILHILQQHVIVIRDKSTERSNITNIYNPYSSDVQN